VTKKVSALSRWSANVLFQLLSAADRNLKDHPPSLVATI
jgi:hypothetical protein